MDHVGVVSILFLSHLIKIRVPDLAGEAVIAELIKKAAPPLTWVPKRQGLCLSKYLIGAESNGEWMDRLSF